jgi:hypothetical protein
MLSVIMRRHDTQHIDTPYIGLELPPDIIQIRNRTVLVARVNGPYMYFFDEVCEAQSKRDCSSNV